MIFISPEKKKLSENNKLRNTWNAFENKRNYVNFIEFLAFQKISLFAEIDIFSKKFHENKQTPIKSTCVCFQVITVDQKLVESHQALSICINRAVTRIRNLHSLEFRGISVADVSQRPTGASANLGEPQIQDLRKADILYSPLSVT